MLKHRAKTKTASSINALSSLLLMGSLIASAQTALADGMRVRHLHAIIRHYQLPPERHVIEGVRPPGSGVFLINGRYFAASTPACMRWVPGDRISLLAGDWHGSCKIAVFRNLRRGGTCTMWCPS